MEKIVYILGAGFSAPLGLPVMSNFLEKSKDQYASNQEAYAHFRGIFEHELRQVHIASGYYQTNVFNIEDILSILEFRARLDDSEDGERRLEVFLRYLKDVIKHYTPMDLLEKNPDNLFPDSNWNNYINFVAAILNCNFQSTNTQPFWNFKPLTHVFADFQRPEFQYSVISFNYDLILESIDAHLKKLLSTRYFHRSLELDDPRNQVYFAKLHGSLDREIVPPTWNKSLNPTILRDWKIAYKVLSEANQIRILGYSLPLTDAYFRFLLRAAIIDAPNLKKIDVICLDETGSVKKSYDDFIKFPNYRFMSMRVENYLQTNRTFENQNGALYFSLENAHEGFVAQYWRPSIKQ